MSDQPKPTGEQENIALHTAAAKLAGADGIVIKPTGEWTMDTDIPRLLGDEKVGSQWQIICDAHNAALADEREKVRTLVELLKLAKCPECDGSGSIMVQTSARQYVTKEMASDAGTPSMEGSIYSDNEWEQQGCQWCAHRDNALAKVAK